MGWCANIFSTLKKAAKEVDDKVLSVADEVIKITGKIKDLNDNPTIEAIEAALGIGSKVHAWIDKALDVIYNVETIGKTIAEKLKEFLDKQPTEFAKNGALAKLASVATSLGDSSVNNRQLKEHVYDQATTIAIAKIKSAA